MQLQICLHTKWRHWKWMFKPFTFQGRYSLVAQALLNKPHHHTHTHTHTTYVWCRIKSQVEKPDPNQTVKTRSQQRENPQDETGQSLTIKVRWSQTVTLTRMLKIKSSHWWRHHVSWPHCLDVIFQHVRRPWAMERSATCKVQWWIVTTRVKRQSETFHMWGMKTKMLLQACKYNNAGRPIKSWYWIMKTKIQQEACLMKWLVHDVICPTIQSSKNNHKKRRKISKSASVSMKIFLILSTNHH